MIIAAIYEAATARGAARILGCTPAYIHHFVKKGSNWKYRIWGRQGIDASKLKTELANLKGTL